MPGIMLRIAVALLTFLFGLGLTSLRSFLFAPAAEFTENRLDLVVTNPLFNDEQELRQIYSDYAGAQTSHDTAFFEQTEAEEFRLFSRTGRTLNRAEDIELLNSIDPSIRYDVEELEIQFQQNGAVVTGQMRATYPNGLSDSWHWIDVCVKRDGRWQILSTTQLD